TELRNLCNQIKAFEVAVNFLQDSPVFSRIVWVVGLITFLAIYIYFALLFSFVYLGVGRLVGSPLSWGEWLVNSLFIPAYVSNFPKSIFLRILAGIHFTLVVTSVIGAVLNYLRARIER